MCYGLVLHKMVVPFKHITVHCGSKPRVFHCSGEGGEADSVLVEGERGVDVLHEAVTEEPDVIA